MIVISGIIFRARERTSRHVSFSPRSLPRRGAPTRRDATRRGVRSRKEEEYLVEYESSSRRRGGGGGETRLPLLINMLRPRERRPYDARQSEKSKSRAVIVAAK